MVDLHYPKYYWSVGRQMIGRLKVDFNVLSDAAEAVPPHALCNQLLDLDVTAHLGSRWSLSGVQNIFNCIRGHQDRLHTESLASMVQIFDGMDADLISLLNLDRIQDPERCVNDV